MVQQSVQQKRDDMKVYSYTDMTRANADGLFAVYLIVKNARGRFFLNTGLVTCGRLTGNVFPKGDPQGRQKTAVLGRYLAEAQRVCLEQELAGVDNATLKTILKSKVFGVEEKHAKLLLRDCVMRFAQEKKYSTRVLYEITARKVEAFEVATKSRQTGLDDVDAAWLEGFRTWGMAQGLTVNGVGKELRNIRAVMNWARKGGLTQNYPFLGYVIVEEETRPNDMSLEELRQLRDWPCEPWQERYRDFFMLSFYLAGMNPGYLLLLPADAVRDGHVSFVRRKTDKEGARTIRQVTLPVVDEAQAIIDRYRGRDYLLSFMDGRKEYASFVKECNKALKKIGRREIVPDKAGKLRKVVYHPLLKDVTLYAARYTFGSIAANELDISERTIGMCLGHSWSRQVTSRYISHDQRKVDMAVRRVVELVAGR